MDNKLIYIPNEDKQDYPFCRLNLLVEMFIHYKFITNQNSVAEA